ncbi:MAG: hypothetical protein ACM3JB_07450 [Acidobacteriaceae bacterium]
MKSRKGKVTMEMFLIILLMSVLTFAVAAIGFKASERREYPSETTQPVVPALNAAPERFFAPRLIPTITVHSQLPIEVLLQQIEDHVRMEQAAAESFVQFPTQAHLHTKTPTPLVN